MKSILVPVEHSASLSAQLETAFLAAAPFTAHIAGVAPRSDFSNYLIGAGAGVGATIPVALEDLQREEDERVQQARSAFRQFVQAHGIVWDDAATPQTHVTAAWIDEINSGDSAVAQSHAAVRVSGLSDVVQIVRPRIDLRGLEEHQGPARGSDRGGCDRREVRDPAGGGGAVPARGAVGGAERPCFGVCRTGL